jgi:hypothetical protein
MKITKVVTIASIMILAATSTVFASWWNPMSWFKKPVSQQTNTLVAPITDNQKQDIDTSKKVVTAHENDTQKSDSEGQGTTTVTAYIVSINGNKITLDYVDVLSGKEACKKSILDGLIQKSLDSCIDDSTYYPRNVNTKLRTFPLSKNVKIFDGRNRVLTLNILTSSSSLYISKIYKKDTDSTVGRGKNLEKRYGSIFTISFDAKGQVINMAEHFSP